MCCAPVVSGQDFMLISLGDCYDRRPQPGMVSECHCDRFLDSCLSLNLLVAMCRLGRKDAERKRVLREKNERLQERINMYESYRKRYLLQAPGRSRGSEFSHWIMMLKVVTDVPSGFETYLKHLYIFQHRMVILPDCWLEVKPPTRISSENVLKPRKHSGMSCLILIWILWLNPCSPKNPSVHF